MTVPDCGGPKREAEAIIIDTMLRIGEVEDEESIDDLSTPASRTGRPIPDFENLDCKIVSGLMKILTGYFRKTRVTTAEGKAQSEKRSVTGKQIAWVIHDIFKISCDNEAIMDF